MLKGMPMIRHAVLAAACAFATPAIAQQAPGTSPSQSATGGVDWYKEFGVERPKPDPATGEVPVKPYAVADANAGATPFAGNAMAHAFGGQPGIRRLADRLVALITADPRIKGIFVATDTVRLRRTLYEQFCYILNAGCPYTGRDMREAHRQLGIMTRDMNALVEDLQRAMREGGIPFATQNRFLAKLAPMKHDIVTK
jgi:hemoglobin